MGGKPNVVLEGRGSCKAMREFHEPAGVTGSQVTMRGGFLYEGLVRGACKPNGH